jgi:hypothetical protein
VTAPSSTAHGRRWLENFEGGELDAATLLIDGLRLVTYEAFQVGLADRLAQLASSERIATPALLLPVLGADDVRAIAERKPLDTDSKQPATAWGTFEPGRYLPGASGSEALISNALRNIATAAPDGRWIAPGASLDDLRDMRCRSLILVTDYAGSGQQVRDFAMTLVRNATIRSWRSLKFIRIHVVSFAASHAAHRLFAQKTCPIDETSTVEIAPTLWTQKWPEVVREEVVNLCRKHKGGSATPFGYRRTGGMFASAFSAPNNLPAILRRKLANGVVFFPYREIVGSFWRELGDYEWEEAFVDRMNRVGQSRRAGSERARRMSRGSRLVLDALAVARRKPSTPASLAHELDIDMMSAEALQAGLMTLGLIDAVGVVTAQGISEHDAGKIKHRVLTAGLSGSDDVYYPSSLR